MKFSYYYGNQSELYSFIKLPRVIVKDEMYRELSIAAKLLYSVLLDRMSLSLKNNWYDEMNRAYIIYQIEEIRDDLGFSKRKSMDALAELEAFGLLEKKRRGHGLPNILYVKNFMTTEETDDGSDTGSTYDESPYEESIYSRSLRNDSSDSNLQDSRSNLYGTQETPVTDSDEIPEQESRKVSEPECHEILEVIPQGTTEQKLQEEEETVPDGKPEKPSREEMPVSPQEVSKTAFQEVSKTGLQEVPETALQEVSESGLQEVPESALLKNNTNMNHTYMNQRDSYLIVSPGREIRCDKALSQGKAEAYLEVIKKHISYDALVHDRPEEKKIIDGIVSLILEIMLSHQEEMLIASNRYPVEIVKSRFMELDIESMRYVLSCLDSNTTEIRNYKKYLLAVLFNAPTTMSGYRQAQVLHRYPQLARK